MIFGRISSTTLRQFNNSIRLNSTGVPSSESFASLFRSSAFVELGDPKEKIVKGIIQKSVGNDLYIDFGHKFMCVCKKPRHRGAEYIVGANVKLMIKNLELSRKFLGYEKEITLMEAEGVIVGLMKQ